MHNRVHSYRTYQDGLDDTDSNGLPHATDSETPKGRISVESLDKNGLAENKLGNPRVTGLDNR